MMTNSNKFGNYLRERLYSSDLNIKECSKLIGINRQTLSNHIYKKTMPKIRMLRQYAKFTGDSVGDLIEMIRSDWGYYSG